ncbi:protein similar-like [Anopheles bellator]|uniref:protein similar-like n=1 Tax=Anopheles bellator TaxID=139047 RepID=UPI00264772EE|nr:protein similar-like [Anopheles bellator]
MQSQWYPPNKGANGSGSGAVVSVYDGGHYGGENVSFYGPPSMGGYPEKPIGPRFNGGPGGYDAGGGGSAATPYEYPGHRIVPPQLQQQCPPGGLYNQSQMLTAVAPATAPNNDYHHQHHHQQQQQHGSVTGGAYQPFYPLAPQPAAPPSASSSPYNTPPEMVGAPNLSSASFLEQPYVSANYAPCQGPPPWNYAYCYGYYGQEACPYVNMVDMEDFMNNEKRKEKSRDAARCRRSRETEIFQDLAGLLPMRQEDVEHLDKASVMRLSIAYLRARNMLELFPAVSLLCGSETMKIKEDCDEPMETVVENKLDLAVLGLEPEKLTLSALDGFLLILSADGDVSYVSENVIEYLGIAQIDIMGQPIWEYSHQCDHDELREALNGRHHSPSELLNGVANSECRPMENRDFFLRLKCTLTSRGRSVNIKSASYKVLHVTGHIACKDKEGQRQLVSIARPLPHPANIEVPLGSSTFLSKHSLGMQFSYVDDKMLSLLGYEPNDLLGKSLYECHHASDAEHLMGTFKHVISKGQSETSRYRFLAKTGGYAWVVTQATVIYDRQKPQSVVCVNYVISGVENEDDILSCAQLEAREQQQREECTSSAGSDTVCSSSTELLVTGQQPPKPVILPVAGGPASVLVKVPADEETIAATQKANHGIELVSSEPLVVSAVSVGAGEVLDAGNVVVCVKQPSASEPAANRILREQNCASGSVGGVVGDLIPLQKAPPTATGSSNRRPVCVTASIFTSLPSAVASVVGPTAAKSAAPIKREQQQQPQPQLTAGTAGSLQSVTAKLFVTLPPPAAGGGSGSGGAGNKPQHATEKIFAPRTEDMNKGFLMFSEEEPGLTMLKDEPDDLTHLAPTAGDACIPLEESGTFFNEIFEDFIIPDSYTLLQDELCSLDSQDTRLDCGPMVSVHHLSPTTTSASPTSSVSLSSSSVPSSPSGSLHSSSPSSSSSSSSSNPNSPSATSGLGSSASSTVSTVDGHTTIQNTTSNDPFINYRDETSEVSPSPHLLSPGISKSPESSSLPSLCSPNGSLPEDELAFMSLNMDELDLSMRAPYISMSEVDDLPLLTSDDLLWGATGTGLEGGAPGASSIGSAFGLSGKFFIKDEFTTLAGTNGAGSSNNNHHTPAVTTGHRQQEHGLITDVTIGAGSSVSATNASSDNDASTDDNKATLTGVATSAPSSIDSSLAALLCGGSVISIQTETANLVPQHNTGSNNNQILIAHAIPRSTTTNSSNQQQQQPQHNTTHQSLQQHQHHHHHQHQHHQQQLQLSSGQQPETGSSTTTKRIKLSEQDSLQQQQQQQSMVVIPTASVKLCDTWKFDDLLQLNASDGTTSNSVTGKLNAQPPTNASSVAASFAKAATTKKAPTGTGGSSMNGNNKRPNDGTGESATGNACKRLKPCATTGTSAPQLLQQLMAPSPLPQKLKSKSRQAQEAAGGRWPNGSANGAAGLLQEQSGNSVLMNLLVSGCDVSAGYSCFPRPSKAAKTFPGAVLHHGTPQAPPPAPSFSGCHFINGVVTNGMPLPPASAECCQLRSIAAKIVWWEAEASSAVVSDEFHSGSKRKLDVQIYDTQNIFTLSTTIPLTPPETLIDDTVQCMPMDTDDDIVKHGVNDMIFSLGEDGEDGVLFSSTNPLIGGQAPLSDSIVRPLTIQTDNVFANGRPLKPLSGGNGGLSGKRFLTESDGSPGSTMDDFMMTVSPTLLTPTDMEIWRAIQQGQLDPKKIPPPSYGGGVAGGRIPQSLSSTPTAQLAELLGDASEANLLAALDPGLNLPLEDAALVSQAGFCHGTGMLPGSFRTIAGHLQHDLT